MCKLKLGGPSGKKKYKRHPTSLSEKRFFFNFKMDIVTTDPSPRGLTVGAVLEQGWRHRRLIREIGQRAYNYITSSTAPGLSELRGQGAANRIIARAARYQINRTSHLGRQRRIMGARTRPGWRKTRGAWKKRRQGAGRSSYAANNIRTAGFLGIVKKFLDVSHSSSLATDASACMEDPSTMLCLNAPAEGTGASQRSTRNVKFTDLHINGYIEFPQLGSTSNYDTPGYCKIWVVMDTQTNGAQMTSDQLLLDIGTAGFDILSQRNLENTDRFKVLAELTVREGDRAAVWDGTDQRTSGKFVPFEIHRKLNMRTKFVTTGTGATIADIQDNSIHVLALATDVGSTNIAYTSRIRYYDG